MKDFNAEIHYDTHSLEPRSTWKPKTNYKCPNCRTELIKRIYDYFCPHCSWNADNIKVSETNY